MHAAYLNQWNEAVQAKKSHTNLLLNGHQEVEGTEPYSSDQAYTAAHYKGLHLLLVHYFTFLSTFQFSSKTIPQLMLGANTSTTKVS